jgi:hypothetical protein
MLTSISSVRTSNSMIRGSSSRMEAMRVSLRSGLAAVAA